MRIVCWDVKDDKYPIVALILLNDNSESLNIYSLAGIWYPYDTVEHVNDLFLAPTVKKYYVNVYKEEICRPFISEIIHPTLDRALAQISKNSVYIKTIEFEIEE